MLRVLTLSALLAAAWVSLPGCEDEATKGQGEFRSEVDKGQRTPPAEKRDPPGPPKGAGGFQKGEAAPGQTPPPPPPPGGTKGTKGTKGTGP